MMIFSFTFNLVDILSNFITNSLDNLIISRIDSTNFKMIDR